MFLKLKDKDIADILINEKSRRNIFLNCPYEFKEKDVFSVFNCRNCINPTCLSACKKDAIYFSSNRVVSIDQDRCNGCGACLSACKDKAIILRKNKAYKCDLCSNFSFNMYCLKNNPDLFELIKDIDSNREEEIINKFLGYKIKEIKSTRQIAKNIVEDNYFKKRYILSESLLSIDEVNLINSIIEEYKLRTEIKESEYVVQEQKLPQKVKDELENILINYCYTENIELESDQFNYVLDVAYNCVYYFGAITNLLHDDSLEEITIIGENKPVFVYSRLFGWIETNLVYTDTKIIRDLINKFAWDTNKYITLKNPLLDATIIGKSRMNAIINPITDSVCITIRKFTEKPFTILDLIKRNTASIEVLSFLSLAFLTDSNIFVVGNTGSGKTTTLNTLLSFIPSDERFVIVEEVREINIPHEHKVYTLVNPELGINIESLVINTLRMRPDRVVIGEVRSRDESIAIIDSMLCGQAKGTYTTFHSQNAKEALQRLVSYGVLENDLGVIDLIIVQRRYNSYNSGKISDLRNITEICEVVYDNQKPVINKLFEFDNSKKKLIAVGKSKKIFDKLKLSYGIRNYSDLDKLLNIQKKKLLYLLDRSTDPTSFEVMKYFTEEIK